MLRMANDWIFFEPDISNVFEITNFDDGNDKYKRHVNQWLIYGKWLGKVALVHAKNPGIRIESISQWKTEKISMPS
jgi:hypothetical protein